MLATPRGIPLSVPPPPKNIPLITRNYMLTATYVRVGRKDMILLLLSELNSKLDKFDLELIN